MHYIDQIRNFTAENEQEATDQKIIVDFILKNPHNVLLRENPIAHITSSGFIMNRHRNKVLLIHHNIRGVWAWTGGHADGDENLLHVAVKEACEETGSQNITPLSRDILSLDILAMPGHKRKGHYINTHLHLSVSYILLCNENEQICPRLSENTAVKWFDTSYFTQQNFSLHDTYLYNKIIDRGRKI